ncbi:MAG: arabinosyltransferase domain-containing protein, partial [Haloechinothrix sp.]
ARGVRARSGLPIWLVLQAPIAAGIGALLLMFYDQSLAAALEAIRIRTEIGPSRPPSAEPERYQRLLDPSMAEGSLGRRVPVLLTGFTLVLALGLLVLRRAPGLRAGACLRLLAAAALFPLVLVFTPTKWTHHFGALAGLGCVVIALLVHTVARGGLRSWLSRAAAVAGFTVVFAAGAAGRNTWWSASSYGVTWSALQPHVGSTPLWQWVLAAGALLTVAMVLIGVFRRRWATPAPSGVILGGALGAVVWLVVLVEVATMAHAVLARRHTYTVGKSSLESLTGGDCGIEDDLTVEPDTSRGRLVKVDGWYVLPTGIAAGQTTPLTIPVSSTGPVTVRVEFGKQNRNGVRPMRSAVLPASTGGTSRDLRFDPAVLAPDADRVRVAVEPESQAEVGVPRLPVVIPLREFVPAGERVALDWPNAFLLPCRRPPSHDDGTVQPVRYRFAAGPAQRKLASGQQSAANGGPYAPLYGLAHATELPTYLRGDSIREPVTVIELDYRTRTTLRPAEGR